jgi:hypothetical protein
MKQFFQTTLLFCLFLSFSSSLLAQQAPINFFRPYDQSGLHVFEPGKADTVPYEGLRVRVGGNFAQQFQALSHENQALPNIVDNVNLNQLFGLAPGFNLATANLNIDVQLEDGIRLNLITYLSSRHHPEAWVKGGFIQFDKLKFFNSEVVDRVMEKLTIRMGHMEVNYGDAHFRRTDNGNAMYNPFVGNYILDAFNTEIGGDVLFQHNGFLAMFGVTAGEINGNITAQTAIDAVTGEVNKRSPSYMGKIGYDNQFDDVRMRLTGSVYHTPSSARNIIYGGDRTGSRYYLVMENTQANARANFTSGRFNPVNTDQVTSFMVNPFVKWKGLEFFGTYEISNGRTVTETETRRTSQLGAELIYRFLKNESLYVAARYNKVDSELIGTRQEVSIDRIQAGMGWFVTPNMVIKAEYVTQNYNDFPAADIRHMGLFNGFVVEAVVGF